MHDKSGICEFIICYVLPESTGTSPISHDGAQQPLSPIRNAVGFEPRALLPIYLHVFLIRRDRANSVLKSFLMFLLVFVIGAGGPTAPLTFFLGQKR